MRHRSNPTKEVHKIILGLIISAVFSQLLLTNAPAQTKANTLLNRLAASRVNSLKVAFTYSPKFPTEGQAMKFTDASKGSPASWLWGFGDGTISTVQNPTHAYKTAGFRKVTLVVADESISKKASRTITIMPSSEAASFVYSPKTPGPGQVVQFADTSTGSPTAWNWDFGDGGTSITKNPSYQFMKKGSFVVSLTVSNSSSFMQTSNTIAVAEMSVLTSSFTFSPLLLSTGQSVQFTDASTGSPTSWLWSFGDGTMSTSQNPSHAFATAGSKKVTLTVANASGTMSSSQTITVVAVLTASFGFSPASPVVGQPIQFNDSSTGGVTSWLWDFNDGTSASIQNPSHTYSNSGSFFVTMTASNSFGSSSVTQVISVQPASFPIASFTFSPVSPKLGQAIQFTDASTGYPESWLWNFGDGASSTLRNPSHVYSTIGTYSLTLTVSNSAGSSSQSNSITIYPATTVIAASASFVDVQAAIDAVESGDTVLVPAGKATWTKQLIITKGISLIGAGVGKTVITGSWVTTGYNQGLIFYLPSNPELDEPFRLSGFEINGNGDGNYKSATDSDYSQLLTVKNTARSYLTKIRIDHNKFYNCGKRNWISIMGHIAGVGDNNIIGVESDRYGPDTTSLANQAARIIHEGMKSDTWKYQTFQYGSAQQFYWEDNTITAASMVAHAYYGAKYAFRNNTITWLMPRDPAPLFDAHGNKSGTGMTGTMGIEIYDNTIQFLYGISSAHLVDHRGGMGLAYNNSSTDNTTLDIQVREEVLDSEAPPETSPDGENQHVCRSYYWNNTNVNGTRGLQEINGTLDYGGDIGIVPQENRDVWFQKNSFDGSSGVGVGPIGSRPASCSLEGAGYWATDENRFYRWHNGTWELYYAPYAHPHPLRTFF